MSLRHNPTIGRGLLKFTFRAQDGALKTSFFARRVNEYISPNDNTPFRNGYTFGGIVNAIWNARSRGDFDDAFVKQLYRDVYGCYPIYDVPTRTTPIPESSGTFEVPSLRDTLRNAMGIRPATFEEVVNSVADVESLPEITLEDLDPEDLRETPADPVEEAVTTTAEAVADAVREEPRRSDRPRRTLTRGYYHQYGNGTSRHGLQAALNRIAADSDGVKRSFGVEYEIYRLTPEQESDLCYLLDDLPPCKPEHDGSLSTNGVELVFDPVGKEDYIRIVRTLRTFIDEHGIYMLDDTTGQGAGMHTTYGVSNSHARTTDTIRVSGCTVPLIQARLNRVSSLMKVCATKQQIKDVFGRYFTSYAQSSFSQGEDSYLRYNNHSNSMSINGRAPVNDVYTCWEFRLPCYKCDPEKVVDFFKATEWVFHHTMHTEDVTAMLNVLLPHNEVED